MPAKYTPEKRIAKFWARIDKPNGEDGCWIWTGGRLKSGYGNIWDGKKQVLVHRFSYQHFNGDIPDGLLVLHECDTPSCCNPAHLFVGTQKENIEDAIRKGRTATGVRNGAYTHPERVPRGNNHPYKLHPEKIQRGEQHSQAKLTEVQVREIRQRHAIDAITYADLARDYAVNKTTIFDIVRRKYWKHIE